MPETMLSLHTVFVSHAHADNELCDRYVAALRERGLDVWYDRTNMQDGHFLSEQIATELERRNGFVVLLTPASVASFWVQLEMQTYLNLLAHDPTRLFLPVRVEDCAVPTLLQAFKWIDAVNLGFEGTVDAMAVALGAPTASPMPEPVPTATSEPVEHADDLLRQAKIADTRSQQARLLHERVNDQLEQARQHQQANPQKAIELGERATQLDPRDADAWSELGKAYLNSGQYNTALAAFDHALLLDDKRIDDWKSKAHTLNFMQRYEEALATYERALKLFPDDTGLWFSKAQLLDSLGRHREAKQAWKRWKYVAFGERSWPW